MKLRSPWHTPTQSALGRTRTASGGSSSGIAADDSRPAAPGANSRVPHRESGADTGGRAYGRTCTTPASGSVRSVSDA
jgi:hypothetical protein